MDLNDPVLVNLFSAVSKDYEFVHIPFDPFPPLNVLKGPVIEVTSLEALDDPGVFEEMSKGAIDICKLAEKQPDCYGSASGAIIEHPKTFVVILSWPTREVSISAEKGI